MNQMTKQEALEFFKGVELKFMNYYKYVFTYEGVKDGINISVNYGGEDIYRDEFGPVESFYDIDFEHFQVLKSSVDDSLLYQFSEN